MATTNATANLTIGGKYASVNADSVTIHRVSPHPPAQPR